jgi:hypothetical protein
MKNVSEEALQKIKHESTFLTEKSDKKETSDNTMKLFCELHACEAEFFSFNFD